MTDMPDEIVLGRFYAPAPMSERFFSVIDKDTKMKPEAQARYIRADHPALVEVEKALHTAFQDRREIGETGEIFIKALTKLQQLRKVNND